MIRNLGIDAQFTKFERATAGPFPTPAAGRPRCFGGRTTPPGRLACRASGVISWFAPGIIESSLDHSIHRPTEETWLMRTG